MASDRDTLPVPRANILTSRQQCRRECSRTFHFEHGGALPGGPFPGTAGDPGDIRRCEHGRMWRFVGTERGGNWIDLWEPLSPVWNPIAWRRARRALVTTGEARDE